MTSRSKEFVTRKNLSDMIEVDDLFSGMVGIFQFSETFIIREVGMNAVRRVENSNNLFFLEHFIRTLVITN